MNVYTYTCKHIHTGPRYVCFTRKPYKEIKVDDTADTYKGEREPEDKSPKRQAHPSIYPSLPPNPNVQHQQAQPPMVWQYHQQPPPPPPPPAQQQPPTGDRYQGYGAPTYPNQHVYQQQGVIYGTGQEPNEQTRLIKQ